MGTDYPGDDRGCGCHDPHDNGMAMDHEAYRRREAVRRDYDSRVTRLRRWIAARLPALGD